ncbi:MAG TPA: AI-2E family transporter [Clostridiaceae bacterium]|nr:AI-2E family transporter [Clostridiaceae bacterium]
MAVKSRKIFYFVIIILIIVVIILFFYRFREQIKRIITPVIMGVIISYLIAPPVLKLEEKKIPRKYSILILYFGFIVSFFAVIIFIVPEIISNTQELTNTVPNMTVEYQDVVNKVITSIESSSWPQEIKNAVQNEIRNTILILQTYLTNLLKKVLSGIIITARFIFDLALAMVIGYYLVKDSDYFKSSIMSLVPRKWRKGFHGTIKELGQVLSNFIQGQLTTAFIVGVMESIGLILLKVKYPLLLGMLGGIANIIPYFGPIIAAVPATAVALIDSPMKGLWTVIMFIFVQQLENVLISPKIIEGKVGLHPVITIIAVLVGGEMFGIIGMIFAVPVTGMIKVIIKRAVDALA